MQCAKCGSDNPEGKKFCGDCGAPLAGEVRAAAGGEPPAAIAGASVRVTDESAMVGLPEGERKTVTALFADIKGSTEIMEELDPEQARAIIDPALALMIDAVHRYGGYVVQSTGDGIFALFGAPVAHEDHPQRALYAALRMQEEIRRYGDNLRAQGGAPVEIRVGVNTGEVVVRSIRTGEGHTEYTPIGHTTNLASRMQTIARTGSIVASEHTQRLIEGYFQTKALGPVQIKGLAQPVNVFEVAGLGPLRTRLQLAARRGLSRFVGRGAEMEALMKAASQARDGRGQIAAAVGEPGVGKSRLFYEFKTVARGEFLVLETFSVSHGKASAYLPVIELLKNYFELAAGDDNRKRREKVLGKVLGLDRSLEEILPEVFSILAIAEGGPNLAQPLASMAEAQLGRQRTLEALKRLLLRESLNQPLLIIFEDLHWIDAESQAFLDLLAGSLGAASILLLVNYRPEYPDAWSNRGTGYARLRLEPLAEGNADELLGSLLGESDGLAALRNFVIGHTEGNPFFIEEMVAALFDQGVLVRDGAVKQVRALAEIRVPATVQGVLASRIDRLAAQEKELLQTMAAIGKQFPLPLLEAVAAKPRRELEGMLGELQRGEFIYEQPAFPDVEYTFKHALTQEVAYNSMLTERRRLLHRRTGDAIEALYSGRLEDHYDELAHHYSRSADNSKAARYLSLAGQQALGRAAWEEARVYAAKGLELLEQLDSPERNARAPEFLLVLGSALTNIKGPGTDETAALWSRAHELSRQTGATSILVRALQGLSVVHAFRGEVFKSRQVGEEALELAQQSGDPARLVLAYLTLGSPYTLAGNLSRARDTLERAIASLEGHAQAADRSQSLSFLPVSQLRSGSLQFLSRTLWLLGFSDQARRASREAISAIQVLGPLAVAHALVRNCDVYILGGEHETVRQHLETLSAIADSELGSVWSGWRSFLKGWMLAQEGHFPEGIALMRDEFTSGLTQGPKVLLTFHGSLLAEACAKAGRIDGAVEVVQEALLFAEASGERFCEAELLRLRGELALMRDASNVPEAERCFRSAIEIAGGQEARSWELRATTSLARLLCNQGKRNEARAMLGEMYGWFTEGFDTADLMDARTLLDELSQKEE
jgi:class 3 adenylate cyclase